MNIKKNTQVLSLLLLASTVSLSAGPGTQDTLGLTGKQIVGVAVVVAATHAGANLVRYKFNRLNDDSLIKNAGNKVSSFLRNWGLLASVTNVQTLEAKVVKNLATTVDLRERVSILETQTDSLVQQLTDNAAGDALTTRNVESLRNRVTQLEGN